MKKTFVNWLGVAVVSLIMLSACSPGIVKESWVDERRYSPRKELPVILDVLDYPLAEHKYTFFGEFQMVGSWEKVRKEAAKRGAEYVALGKGTYTLSHVEKDVFGRTTKELGSDVYDMVHVSMYRRTSAEEREAMALSEVIKSGNINRVRSSIASGYDVNAKTPKGHTALMVAARGGHLEIVKALLKAGADVNVKTPKGHTALIWAAQGGHLELVKALLKAGADANAKTPNDYTALNAAAQGGHLELAKALLKAGADVNTKGYTALMWAAGEGHLELVKALLKAGADVHAKTPKGWTALMSAAGGGHLELVKALLKAGADVHAKIKGVTFPDSALELASNSDHADVVKLLKEYGAKWN